MRVYVEIPEHLVPRLRDLAHAAHRPPRYQLEFLIRHALEAPGAPANGTREHAEALPVPPEELA